MRCSSSTRDHVERRVGQDHRRPRRALPEAAHRLLDLVGVSGDRAAQPLERRAQRVLRLREHRHRVPDHVLGDHLAVPVVDHRRAAPAAGPRAAGSSPTAARTPRARGPACGRTPRSRNSEHHGHDDARGAPRAPRCRSDGSSCGSRLQHRGGAAISDDDTRDGRRRPPTAATTRASASTAQRRCMPTLDDARYTMSNAHFPTKRKKRSAARYRRRTPP